MGGPRDIPHSRLKLSHDILITILRTSEDKGTISIYQIIRLTAYVVTGGDTLRYSLRGPQAMHIASGAEPHNAEAEYVQPVADLFLNPREGRTRRS
ncbi:hypothetical protein BDY19DRAFT_998579 [Irpex rosettiformis]|uniref:Uncharacterized protein n=1 Tax=Irpex rosettiformis TaxID=378272 RepID=A0ACB8TN84_9APHY|nr:hypothetical protein BDY19DRAFT_998579 [Irpex rosettiformis]